MPSNNSAAEKELLSRNKVTKILHPKSRKSIAIVKKSKRKVWRQKVKLGSVMKQSLVGEKMLWIRDHMNPDVCPYTQELTAQLLEKYIGRNDEELEQIGIKHSIGGKRKRQHANREDILKMTKQREMEEYQSSGIEIPDILDPVQCRMLKNWTGELRFLQNFKFRRFRKPDESQNC